MRLTSISPLILYRILDSTSVVLKYLETSMMADQISPVWRSETAVNLEYKDFKLTANNMLGWFLLSGINFRFSLLAAHIRSECPERAQNVSVKAII